MNIKGNFKLSETVFGGEGKTGALTHTCASPWAALSRWQFPEAFFCLLFFHCVWKHRLYLMSYADNSNSLSYIALEYVFTVCSGRAIWHDESGHMVNLHHNIHIKIQYYYHAIVAIKLCTLIKNLQVLMYHREQNQKYNLFLKVVKDLMSWVQQ